MTTTPLHQRIRIAVGRRSFREIGDLTQTHPESVRRYVQGQSPSAEFLQNLAGAMEISSEWLMQGRGPMRRADMRMHALKEANSVELLTTVAESLEKLIDRVDRMEVFLHTLEARLRIAGTVQPFVVPAKVGDPAPPAPRAAREERPREGVPRESGAGDVHSAHGRATPLSVPPSGAGIDTGAAGGFVDPKGAGLGAQTQGQTETGRGGWRGALGGIGGILDAVDERLRGGPGAGTGGDAPTGGG